MAGKFHSSNGRASAQWRSLSFAALCVIVSFSIASSAAALDTPDHCIVGDNAIGCRSVRTLATLTDGFRGNGDALHREIESQIDSGTCRLFEYGERVYSTDIEGGLRSAVRRPRDASTWFMPASWSRPASECGGVSTPQALQHKLGLAESPRREPDSQSEVSAGMAPAGEHLALASAGPTACVIKPVMTDAEIAACRKQDR